VIEGEEDEDNNEKDEKDRVRMIRMKEDVSAIHGVCLQGTEGK